MWRAARLGALLLLSSSAVATAHINVAAADCAAGGAAVPNDASADQTAAINAALSACAGQKVALRPGIYRVDGTITVGTPGGNVTLAAPPSHLFLPMGAELRRYVSP